MVTLNSASYRNSDETWQLKQEVLPLSSMGICRAALGSRTIKVFWK